MTEYDRYDKYPDSKYGSGSAAAPLPEVGPKVSAVILANKHLASLISLTFKHLRYWKSAWTMARENHTLKTPIIAHQLQYPFGLPSAGPSWCKQTWLTKLNPSQYIPILTLQALQALHDAFGGVEMILAPCSSGYVAGFWASWTWSNSDFVENRGVLAISITLPSLMFKQFSTANDKWQGKVFISYNHLLGILTLTKKEVETVETCGNHVQIVQRLGEIWHPDSSSLWSSRSSTLDPSDTLDQPKHMWSMA